MPPGAFNMLKMITARNAFETKTLMTRERIVDEIETGAGEWVSIPAVNDQEEDVTLKVRRSEIIGYVVAVFHPADLVQQRLMQQQQPQNLRRQ